MSQKLNLTRSNELWQEALELVPGGVLGIRRPYNFVTYFGKRLFGDWVNS